MIIRIQKVHQAFRHHDGGWGTQGYPFIAFGSSNENATKVAHTHALPPPRMALPFHIITTHHHTLV